MDPDVTAQIQLLKKTLKSWEGKFVKESNRKPNKDDISQAEDDIKDAYAQYAKLKKEQQISVVPNQGAWGTELNKSHQQTTKADRPGENGVEESTDSGTSFMSKLSRKLYEHASGTPRPAPKPSWSVSRSSSQTKDPSTKTTVFSSQKSISRQCANTNGVSPHSANFNSNTKTNGCEKENKLCLEESEISNMLLSSSSVLSKVSKKSKKSNVQPDADLTLPVGYTSQHDKSRLTEKYKHLNKFSEKIEGEMSDLVLEPMEPFVDCSTEADKPPDRRAETVGEVSTSPSKQITKRSMNLNKAEDLKSSEDMDLKDVDFNDSFPFENETEIKSCQANAGITRGTKRKASDHTIEEVTNSKKVQRTETPSSRQQGNRRLTTIHRAEPDEDWENAGISEVAWKSDEPRVDLEAQDTGQQDEADDENMPHKVKTSRSRGAAKPVSNDNFVRLNMKLKTYKRKGQAMTGGKYKRMQWKQKMKARSESFGNKCFKCGEAGHWANKCKGKGKASVPSMAMGKVTQNSVVEGDFPSLQEAVGMARGKKPAASKASKSQNDRNADVNATVDVVAADADEELDLEMEVYRPGYEAPAPPAPVDPLYDLNSDGSLPEPTAEVFDALHMFGFSSFRKGQERAVMRILCGLSTLVILSTGSGKSLCYQLASYIYATRLKAITLVISPLVSLMEDQVTGLPAGINGACLHTNMTPAQRKRVLETVAEGKIHFLLVSPEAMTSSSNSLLGSTQLPPIAFACIDEAHCVSEWSHHFRPSYLRICKVLRETYGVKCMLGLTATATMVTAASVAQHLGIHDYRTSTIRDIPIPTNLLLSASRDENKDEALLALLQGDRFSACGSVIIYCTRREQTTRISTLIRTSFQDVRAPPAEEPAAVKEVPKKGKGKAKGKAKAVDPSAWTAECYHAGLSPAQRRRVQNAFMSGRLRVVVATVAFGMGVDKSDVRGIVHYTMPKSFESYVQEVGRAGRDGKPSHCHVFLDHMGKDANELKRHIHSNTIDRFVIKKLVKKFFPPCRCEEKHKNMDQPVMDGWMDVRTCPGHERAVPIDKTVQDLDIKEEGISTLLCYLELHPRQWVVNLQSVYATCTIQCYGGSRQLQHIAQKCPAVGVAIAKQQKRGAEFSSANSLEFPIIDISDSMGWESGPVKRELKQLEWNLEHPDSGPRKSGALVTFTELAFHLMSPGDLGDEEIDEIVDFLNERIQTQERTELGQLQRLQDTLRGVSHKDVWMCADHVDTDRSDKLKASLRVYFDEQPEIRNGQVTMLSFAREYGSQDQASVLEDVHCDKEQQIRSDVRQFVHLYGSEHSLTGRAVARIFHGIPSPCFPSMVWGRVRRFWRCNLDVDFNAVRQIATQQLIQYR